MGYSVSVRASSISNLLKMRKFLDLHFVDFKSLLGNEQIRGEIFGCKPSLFLEYDRHKKAIGFNYPSWVSGEERYYIYSISRWMSLKIGLKYKFKGVSLPAILYDGIEKIPVVQNGTKFEENGTLFVDSLGYVEYRGSFIERRFFSRNNQKKISNKVKNELVRLEEEWNKLELVLFLK